MFADRQIADPIIAAQVFRDPPKGELATDLLRRLKVSQKDMENRIHPWMNTEIKDQIRELESDESRSRRRTIRGDTNLSGHRPTSKEEKPSFKGSRADFDNIGEDQIDDINLKGKSGITHSGGKPTEGACVNGCTLF